jgi:hypothetical protein
VSYLAPRTYSTKLVLCREHSCCFHSGDGQNEINSRWKQYPPWKNKLFLNSAVLGVLRSQAPREEGDAS